MKFADFKELADPKEYDEFMELRSKLLEEKRKEEIIEERIWKIKQKEFNQKINVENKLKSLIKQIDEQHNTWIEV